MTLDRSPTIADGSDAMREVRAQLAVLQMLCSGLKLSAALLTAPVSSGVQRIAQRLIRSDLADLYGAERDPE